MGTHGDHQPPSKRPRRESARMQNANAILARDEENPLQPYILHFDDIGLLDPHNLHDIILELSEPFQQSTIWLIFCENAGFKSKISEIYAQWRPIRGLTIDDIETCRDSTYKNNTVHYRWGAHAIYSRATMTYFKLMREAKGRGLIFLSMEAAKKVLDYMLACWFTNQHSQDPWQLLLGSRKTFLEMWQESIKMIEEGNLHETSTLQDSGTMAPEASGRDLKKSPLAPAIHLPLEKVEPSKTNQQLDDIISSLKMVPSNVTPALKDVFGLDHLKKTLLVTIQTIQGRQRHPHLSPPRGLNGFLIFGPPGIGKSVLIAALAKEVSWSFYQINSGSDAPKFAGKTEKAIIHLFDRVIEEDNAIIYFEECETLIKIRDSPSSQSYESASPAQILAGWDKVINSGKNIIIIAASNYPWLIDAGMLRRLQRRIMLSLPDEAARIQLIQYFLRPYPNNLKEKHINKLVPITNGRSGHDIQTAIDIAYSTVYTYYEADAKCFSQINDNGEDIWVPSAVGTSTTVFELDNQHKKSRPQDLTLRILERQFKLQGKSSTEAQSQNLQEWNEKMGNSISAFNPSEFFE